MAEYKGLFPTRYGTAQGGAAERTMLDVVGADDIRTRIRNHPDGSTTTLRTRNGFPEFTTTSPAEKDEDAEEYDRGFCFWGMWYDGAMARTAKKPWRINRIARRIQDVIVSYWDRVKKARVRIRSGIGYSVAPHMSKKPSNILERNFARYNDVFTIYDGKLYQNGRDKVYVAGSKRVMSLPPMLGSTVFVMPQDVGSQITWTAVSVGSAGVTTFNADGLVIGEYATSTVVDRVVGAFNSLGAGSSAHQAAASVVGSAFWVWFSQINQSQRNYVMRYAVSSGGHLDVTIYDNTHSTGVNYEEGGDVSEEAGTAWLDAPSVVAREMDGGALWKWTYTMHGFTDNGQQLGLAHLRLDGIFKYQTDFDIDSPTNGNVVRRYTNKKDLDVEVPIAVIGGELMLLRRQAHASVEFEKKYSYGWAWLQFNGEISPEKWADIDANIVGGHTFEVAHGNNTRYTNTANTTFAYNVGSITLAVGEFSMSTNHYSWWADYVHDFVYDGYLAALEGRTYPDNGVPSNIFFVGNNFGQNLYLGGDWGSDWSSAQRTTASEVHESSTASGAATVRDYIYYDPENHTEIYLEFQGTYSGPVDNLSCHSTLDVVVVALGTTLRKRLTEHSYVGHKAGGVEVEFIYNETHKPTYCAIPKTPCAFAPLTHQGEFRHIAYVTLSESNTHDAHEPANGRFLLSLPLVLSRPATATVGTAQPDYPAFVYVAHNIDAMASFFASAVLTQEGGRVFEIAVAEGPSGNLAFIDWLEDDLDTKDEPYAANAKHHADVWRY